MKLLQPVQHTMWKIMRFIELAWFRLEPIMLFKLPIMLLSNAPKIFPIMPQLCSTAHNYAILCSNSCNTITVQGFV